MSLHAVRDDDDAYESPEPQTRMKDVKRYRGKLFLRPRPDIDRAVEEILAGGVVYGAVHPLFVVYPLLIALAGVVGTVIFAAKGSEPGFDIAGIVVIACVVWFFVKLWLMIHVGYVALFGQIARVGNGILSADPIDLDIKLQTQTSLKHPPRGLGRLSYATWQPDSAGTIRDPKVNRIMYMEELLEIMLLVKSSLQTQQAHDEGVLAATEEVGRKLGFVVDGINELVEIQKTTNQLLRQILAASPDRDATAGLSSALSQLSNQLQSALAPPPDAPPESPPPRA